MGSEDIDLGPGPDMNPAWVRIAFISVVSFGTPLLLAMFVVDVVRRGPRFPSIEYKGRRPSARAIQLGWLLLLVMAFVAGIIGVLDTPFLEASRTSRAYETGAAAGLDVELIEGDTAIVARTALPFYESETVVYRDEDGYERFESYGSRIPWEFLVASWMYWILVVRWPKTAELEDRHDPTPLGGPDRSKDAEV